MNARPAFPHDADIHRLIRQHSSAVHFIFEWDRETGFSCDRVNYGPMNISSSSWIVPGSIEEEEELSDD
jgi:hypothetical protein